ncbi:MAG: SDR family oxidoreductase [Planctomycetota bacterium]|nr:SDR family oxidoreductase [Planctomycetota bacterium]
MDSGLAGKVVLVTGASGGIGQAAARAFAAEGARVALHGHTNRAALERLAAELPGQPLALAADLTREADVEALYAALERGAGRLDAVVANAGVWPPADEPIHRMSLERWRSTLDADLTSAFLTARGYFRYLERAKPERASLTLVGSTAALFGEAGHADYAAAKAGLAYGLTRSLKNEIVRLVPKGRVNAVCPGWTLTSMAKPGLQDTAGVRRVLQTRAHTSIARPEDVAAALVFLSSEHLAGHLTGVILPVAGGMEGRILHKFEDLAPGIF